MNKPIYIHDLNEWKYIATYLSMAELICFEAEVISFAAAVICLATEVTYLATHFECLLLQCI